jgi:molecular chaperone GrpE (heat shock protein)
MLSKNIRSVHKKLKRLLQARDLVEIEFPENMARIDACKVVDTRIVPGAKNETILSVVKKGYVDKKNGKILRKAEVITVLNEA